MLEALAARRQPVFFLRAHFAEGAVEPVRQKQWIVAEAPLAARRPDDDAVDARFELLRMLIRPSEAQRGDEVRAALLRAACAAFDQKRLDAVQRAAEVFLRPGPSGRVNAGFAVERIDTEPGVVGESGEIR